MLNFDIYTCKFLYVCMLLTTAAVSTHPDQTASIVWTRGKDGYATWPH